MKTAKELLQALPEEIREKALTNLMKNGAEEKEFNRIHSAIVAGFSWGASEEGFEYWNDIFNKAFDGNFDVKPESNVPDIQFDGATVELYPPTIGQDWLKMLPEEIALKVGHYIKDEHYTAPFGSLHEFLKCFIWANTPEGHGYWSKVCQDAERGVFGADHIVEGEGLLAQMAAPEPLKTEFTEQDLIDVIERDQFVNPPVNPLHYVVNPSEQVAPGTQIDINTVEGQIISIEDPEIRAKAIANLRNEKNEYSTAKDKCLNWKEAIGLGFAWGFTPEGFEYWNKIWSGPDKLDVKKTVQQTIGPNWLKPGEILDPGNTEKVKTIADWLCEHNRFAPDNEKAGLYEESTTTVDENKKSFAPGVDLGKSSNLDDDLNTIRALCGVLSCSTGSILRETVEGKIKQIVERL